MKESVVFDTSFLINCVKAKINPLHEVKMKLGIYEAIIPGAVMNELENLSQKNKFAKVTLEMVKKSQHTVVEGGNNADKSVVYIAAEREARVASTDKEVRQNAKALELKLVTLRKGKYVLIEDNI